ncbi:MAG: hypothetical protein A2583_10575 [Bdellovibrionales bacterium RIFOXYD1_FULL_53_11]|nr:MAG: hypothetical protein A2583_10575 [Bdellovibrionales bacterium RIFOXYD1_FULL_53_11]
MLNTISAVAVLLSTFATNPSPWLNMEANSEQRQPVYLGAPPRDIMLGRVRPKKISMPVSLKKLGSSKAKNIVDLMRKKGLLDTASARTVELETWPVRDDAGRISWAFARWRTSSGDSWKWLDANKLDLDNDSDDEAVTFVSTLYNPRNTEQHSQLFDDILLMKDLYTKPLFGDCIWTNETGTEVRHAWLATSLSGFYKELLHKEAKPLGEQTVCRLLPQPARFNGKPVSFVLKVSSSKTTWPASISWTPDKKPALPALSASASKTRITNWQSDFLKAYRDDLLALDGEEEAVFPRSGRKMRFTRKNNITAHNQLLEQAAYLEERYTEIGIKTWRDDFIWRGEKQTNLIAVIPGSLKGLANKPVLMADHYDTAFCEDVFNKNGQRIAAPGADDNASASAALIRAAVALKNSKPRHDIWLVHLTGEEYPADDLGARNLTSRLLREKRDISGMIVMDMIGYDPRGRRLMQVNAGNSQDSIVLAAIAMNAAETTSPMLNPVFRSRFDERSYLYNTDGLILSDAGYPVILLNEHINRLENLSRPGYHQTTDLSNTMDFDYATAIVKVAIETAARLAGAQ